MRLPASSDPAIEVAASPVDARPEGDEWWACWSTLPTVEPSRPAADVLVEIRDDD